MENRPLAAAAQTLWNLVNDWLYVEQSLPRRRREGRVVLLIGPANFLAGTTPVFRTNRVLTGERGDEVRYQPENSERGELPHRATLSGYPGICLLDLSLPPGQRHVATLVDPRGDWLDVLAFQHYAAQRLFLEDELPEGVQLDHARHEAVQEELLQVILAGEGVLP